jgi:hypothetical protein
MAQMTWRVSDELLEQVRRHAQRQGRSLNDWVTTVMAAASDPAYATDEAAALRERLDRAGLLEAPTGDAPRRPAARQVAAARARAGTGEQLSDLVIDQRR